MMEFEEAVTVPVPIPVFCGPIIRRDMTRPCSVYFDLTILPDNDSDSSILLHSVTFDNFFTYSVTVMQPIGNTDDYCTILEGRQLMHEPDAETDAQMSHVVLVSEFNAAYIPGRAMRFLLHQPSNDWKVYELRNIKAFARPVVVKRGGGQEDGGHGGDVGMGAGVGVGGALGDMGAVTDIEELLMADFRSVLARSNKVTHNKLALGSHLEVEIVTKKAKKKKKSTAS